MKTALSKAIIGQNRRNLSDFFTEKRLYAGGPVILPRGVLIGALSTRKWREIIIE